MALTRIPVPYARMQEWRHEYMNETQQFLSKHSSNGILVRFMEWLQDKTNYTINPHYPTSLDYWDSWDLVCQEHEAVQVKLTWL